MKLRQLTFTTRIASSFLLLALLAVSTVGGVAFWNARRALEKAAYSRLNVTATLKEKEISRWLESCEEDFLLITTFPTVQANLQKLLNSEPDSPAYKAAERELNQYLGEIAEVKPKFTEISVQSRSNQIVLSTDPAQEGKYVIATNLTYIEEVVSGDEFAPVFYVSPETGKPAITYAAPVRDSRGQRQGVILADLNLKRIDDIVKEENGLDQTSETYVIGSLANKTAFISRSSTDLQNFPDGPQSPGIQAALQGQSGRGLYDNYLGRPVIGVYHWLTEQDIALLVEMEQSEAFEPARRLALALMLVGFACAGVLLIGVNRLARQLGLSRKQLENYSRKLEQTAKVANAANRSKSEFLANMSHELRTPLNAILGFTQLMSRTAGTTAVQRDYLGIISRSGEHLLNLINDVLSMSKIEAGRTTLDPTRFDLYHLLTTLEEMLRIKAEAKGIHLYFKISPEVPQAVKTDEGKLRQVLVNLLGNAIKFTQAGSVTLMVEAAEPVNSVNETTNGSADVSVWLRFKIQDTGPGIDTGELDHLFDPFFQAAKTRTTHQGTGLGLAISQRFVKLMGGQIEVQSAAGEGAAFSFSIPVQPTEAVRPSQPADRRVVGLMPGQPEYRILVVDDAIASRRLLNELLSPIGFSVRTATNGRAALSLHKSWHPHLIWMDMRMPIMDGYEATRQIRSLPTYPSTPNASGNTARTSHHPITPLPHHPPTIIALTASAFEEDRAAVIACGCDDFVRKPFQEQVIFDKMAKHLGVQYRYETIVNAATHPASESSPHSASGPSVESVDLSVMPADWIKQLHTAAVQVDAEKLLLLIQQIPTEYSVLSQALKQLIHNYGFDEIIDLTAATHYV